MKETLFAKVMNCSQGQAPIAEQNMTLEDFAQGTLKMIQSTVPKEEVLSSAVIANAVRTLAVRAFQSPGVAKLVNLTSYASLFGKKPECSESTEYTLGDFIAQDDVFGYVFANCKRAIDSEVEKQLTTQSGLGSVLSIIAQRHTLKGNIKCE